MTEYWQTFWSNYGPERAGTEDDLFKQVGHTVNRQPIRAEQFRRIVVRIVEQLRLSPTDHLVDLCCGNGLLCYELAAHVAYVTGIDFVLRNIDTARQWKSANNITYILGDVLQPLPVLVGENVFPGKFLMNVSLAYFAPEQFDTILGNIVRYAAGREISFLLAGIPHFNLKWRYYNTPARVARHLENEKTRENTNDGLGRWWHADEIESVVSRYGLQVQIMNQPPEISDFRMDALITSPS